MSDDLHRLTTRRAAHHAGFDVPWDAADEARYQALALPPEQRVARQPTDEERAVLDHLREQAQAAIAKAAARREAPSGVSGAPVEPRSGPRRSPASPNPANSRRER